MRKFLIATHGNFSIGIKSSLDMIIGAMDNVFTIQAYLDEKKSFEDSLKEILKEIADGDELIIFTDLLGGSITNKVLQHALKEHVHIVAGFNLPLLIDILMADPESPIVHIIESAIQIGREQMVYVNKLIPVNTEANDHD